MPKILHFFSNFSSLGGVESILKLHAASDPQHGLDSAMVIACETITSQYAIPVEGLGIRGWHNVGTLRRRFRDALARHRPTQIVFHNAWACRHLVDLIGEARCILMIHTDSEVSRNAIRKCAPIADLILSVSRPIARFVETQTEGERAVVLDYPIDPPAVRTRKRDSGPLRVGYIGRLVTEQKRVERLPVVLRQARDAGVELTFELLGEGHCRESLEKELSTICPTVFHGRLGGERYWQVLRSWDCLVFTSDYEGTPIALLEAMSQGVIPVYPTIGSGGDDLIGQVDAGLLYPAGQPPLAADVLRRVAALSGEERTSLQARLISRVERNRPGIYLDEFRAALAAAVPLPERPIAQSALASFPMAALPFAAVRRMDPNLIY